ncbi:MAG: hypothetical protein ACFFCQ_13045, partial [Promethearchaeota archaeon]
MPKTMTWCRVFFLIIIFGLLLNSQAISKALGTQTNEEDIEILQVTLTGYTLSIILDFDFSNAFSQLETQNSSLTVLVLFGNYSQQSIFNIDAVMLFIHTVANESFLFWMFGNPYQQIQFWQLGTENEHYQINGDQLTLYFLEYSKLYDSDITIYVFAKIITDFEVNQSASDFSFVLEKFIRDLPQQISFPSVSDTTSEKSTTETDSLTSTATESESTTKEAPSLIYGFELVTI